MKTKHILVLLAVITTALVGCSSLTPAPQVKIVRVSPSSIVPDSSGGSTVQITFRNYNHVDAIVTTEKDIFYGYRDSSGITVLDTTIASPNRYYSLFVPGNTDSISLTVTIFGLSALRTAMGSPTCTWFMRFSGTDTYGSNKEFSDTCKVAF
jgi:hypothetical protein